MNITIELDEHESWGLAEFIKRIGYEDVRRHSKDEDEARDGFAAIEKIRIELEKNGVKPR